jgi:NAD(P)-dependent dehydrogenase (short-subunit alcohol dehydrogenase family)
MDPAGRHALVTGGGRGIGAAIARALTEAGARVTILGRTEKVLRDAVANGVAARFMVADVSDAASIARALGDTDGQGVEILVNNAGAVETSPFGRLDRAAWDRMIAVNLTSVYEMSHAILPGMVARGWGRVVNVASTAGLTGYPYVSAYVAAKHGVVGLTRALALETARSAVTVNAVCPGFAETDLLVESIANVVRKTGRSEDDVRKSFSSANPQGRFVAPEEVAAAVLFLCGPASGAVTGQAIAVAGGEVM